VDYAGQSVHPVPPPISEIKELKKGLGKNESTKNKIEKLID
jgi:hypothetical protein